MKKLKFSTPGRHNAQILMQPKGWQTYPLVNPPHFGWGWPKLVNRDIGLQHTQVHRL